MNETIYPMDVKITKTPKGDDMEVNVEIPGIGTVLLMVWGRGPVILMGEENRDLADGRTIESFGFEFAEEIKL